MTRPLDGQNAMVEAVLKATEHRDLVPVGAGVPVARGMAAYRNNVRVLAGQALSACFPRVLDALGETDFKAMAWSFWRHHPPRRGDLGEWGQALPAFLSEQAGEASGLPRLACLDWACHQAERAADAPLNAESLALLGTEPLDALRLQLRPAVRLVDSHELVWREGWKAQHRPLRSAEAAFFQALIDQCTLSQALQAAAVKGLEPPGDFDFGAWLQEALRHEWLHQVVRLPL